MHFSRLEWQKRNGKIKVQERHSKHKLSKGNSTKASHIMFRSAKGNKNRTKRSFSKPRYVEALLVADTSMVEFHEEGDVETYLLSIMNMVGNFEIRSPNCPTEIIKNRTNISN